MGSDGHVGSLYPKRSEALMAKPNVLPVVKSEGAASITFSLPVMNAASKVVVSLTGSGKAAAVRRALEGGDGDLFPGAMVRPTHGDLVWVIDQGAASELESYKGALAL